MEGVGKRKCKFEGNGKGEWIDLESLGYHHILQCDWSLKSSFSVNQFVGNTLSLSPHSVLQEFDLKRLGFFSINRLICSNF